MKRIISALAVLALLAPIPFAAARDAGRDELMRVWKESQRIEQKKAESARAEAVKAETATAKPVKSAPAPRYFTGTD
ncbi:MAG: hypothetical protein HY912_12105 [Desulfomonile tiedjei]|uniref:Uncharacterized protein n=1 Tax=Desulfomonile tiedjei TaxID=2358 RepID=A0A9D6Z3T3_9BACT|nr:hypothetical protein [Desulfomonile tiedjei]